MNPKSKTESPKPTHKATLLEKFAWGAGGMSESLVNSIYALAFPIYSIGLGVSPALIGIAKAAPRLVDALTDPIMGNISDNARTRWGRRRPFIFIGAILIGIIYPIIWLPNPGWSEMMLFTWLTALTIFFFLGFTIWNIPWSAMGMELSDDYNDRTKVQVARMIFATIAGLGNAWVYKLCFLFNSDEIIGVRYTGFIIGSIIMVGAILSAFFIKEWRHVDKQMPIRLLTSLKMTLSNRPFLLLCGTIVAFAIGLVMVDPLLLYVNIYHVFDGDRSAASTIMGISGTCGVIISVLMLPIGGKLSEKFGKRNAAFCALTLMIIGKGSQYLLVTPDNPYLQLICRIIYQPGLMLMWALIPSMIADVCDLDELENGNRREASFSSVFQWIWKLGATIAMALSGILISLAGASVSSPDDLLSYNVVFRLRLILAIVPVIFAIIAMVLLWRYPLTHKRVNEIKEQIK
ncbi:MFS transporter [Coraliomargarita sp. SDUM461004]|uniref:MFS transporter n=1 Tax=Thalassobacterium sedimentorum TaxID=3041258 RepID=A0ABU1AFC3_9BACT|nr:MFS transporter [Coraliomargarita sp. SDUM461004]MDQ8193511.1 MFS transporter [Coraliomargarita sp. SDUM461004]